MFTYRPHRSERLIEVQLEISPLWQKNTAFQLLQAAHTNLEILNQALCYLQLSLCSTTSPPPPITQLKRPLHHYWAGEHHVPLVPVTKSSSRDPHPEQTPRAAPVNILAELSQHLLIADGRVTVLVQTEKIFLASQGRDQHPDRHFPCISTQTLKLYTPISRFKRKILRFSSVINIHTAKKGGGILLHTDKVCHTELKAGHSKIICQTARKGEHEQTKVCDSEQINFIQYTWIPQRGEH